MTKLIKIVEIGVAGEDIKKGEKLGFVYGDDGCKVYKIRKKNYPYPKERTRLSDDKIIFTTYEEIKF